MYHAQNSTVSGSFPNSSLKRTRSGELPRRTGEIPRLPDVGADLVLEVFTHESLRPAGSKNPEEYSDNKRLYQLGKVVLDTAVTLVLFGRRPFLSVDEIEDRKAKILSDTTIQGWVNSYQMSRKIRCIATYLPKLQTPEESRTVFCAYVGAVYTHSGQEAVNNWTSLLITYQEQQDSTMTETPPAKKIKNEPSLISFAPQSPMSSTSSESSRSQTYSPTSPYLNPPQQYSSAYPARQLPPHMNKPPFQPAQPPNLQQLFQSLASLSQSTRSMMAPNRNQLQQTQFTRAAVGQGRITSPSVRPNPLAPATPNAPFLPLFNQTASQRGVKVDYPADFNGPAHAGQWTVRCVVNGIPKGEGKGSSKQVAKEEAARQAYYAMGWT